MGKQRWHSPIPEISSHSAPVGFAIRGFRHRVTHVISTFHCGSNFSREVVNPEFYVKPCFPVGNSVGQIISVEPYQSATSGLNMWQAGKQHVNWVSFRRWVAATEASSCFYGAHSFPHRGWWMTPYTFYIIMLSHQGWHFSHWFWKQNFQSFWRTWRLRVRLE